ncbi:MAG: FtsK/SpoIIIE domain-containing protein, partial [Steroidobacteraceae bacterium]
VAAELERRYPIFREDGAEQLKSWNRMHPDRRQPYIVVIVDERAEATVKAGSADQEEQLRRKQTVALLSTVGRMGRALGIHLVLCTQRPDADVLPGQIKGQMGATIAFRARDFVQSEVLLGQGDMTAAMLPQEAKGRAYYKGSEEGVMVQTPLVTPEEAEAVVRRIVAEVVSGGGGQSRSWRHPPRPGAGRAGFAPGPGDHRASTEFDS